MTIHNKDPIPTDNILTAEEIAEMRARFLVKPTPLGRPILTDPVRADMTRLLDALENAQDAADILRVESNLRRNRAARAETALAVMTEERDDAVRERDMLRDAVAQDGAIIECLQDQAGSAMPGASRTLVAVVKAAGGEIHIPHEVLEGIEPRDAVVVKDDPLRGGQVVCAFKAPRPIPVAKPVETKFTVEESAGGSCGPKLTIKADGRYVAHLYIDAERSGDGDSLIRQIEHGSQEG